MANTIKLKRSSTASDTPTASDLEVGELAINTADAKLFTKHTDNSIKEISGTGGDVVDDTSPQLGGDLQSNGNDIDLADNDKLIAGTGGDLEVYSDGTDAYIDFVGADSETLFIRNTTAAVNGSDGISIQTKGTSPHYINMRNNAGLDLGVFGSDKMTVSTTGIYSNVGYILNNHSYEIKWRNTSNNTYLGLKGASGTTANTTITLPNLDGTAVVEETGGVTLNNGVIDLKNGGTQSEVRLYCETSNEHYAALKAPAHADFSGDVTSTLPSVTGTLIGTANADAPTTTTSSSDADHVLINDGGVLKKITPSDLGIGSGGSYANSDVDTHLNTSTASANEVLSWNGSDYDWVAQSGGGGGSASDSFKTIAVSGQSNVVADSSTDTLTYVAGSNMTITTDASTDTITFASSGSGGSSNLSGLSDVNITSVADGDLLRYNGTASEWQNTNLGLTITPTFTIPTTNVSSLASTITVTVTNHSTLQADDVHYSAAIKRSSDDAVIIGPTSTSVIYGTSNGQMNGTITFNIASTFSSANEGTSYYIALTAQTFGDLQSEVATQTFTIVAPPQISLTSGSYRYYRLADFAAQVYLLDWQCFSDINQGGTSYPSTNATSNSWTSDGQTNTLDASYAYPSAATASTYDDWKAMDSSSSTGWWTLGNSSYSTHTLTWDAGTARTIKSMEFYFHDRYTNTVSSGDNAFIVQGSNDNTNWTTIATVTAADEDFDATGFVYTTVLLSDTS